MVDVVMFLIRLFFGLLLALSGALCVMVGAYGLGGESARLFGDAGVWLLVGLLSAAACWAGSLKLLRGMFRGRAAA